MPPPAQTALACPHLPDLVGNESEGGAPWPNLTPLLPPNLTPLPTTHWSIVGAKQERARQQRPESRGKQGRTGQLLGAGPLNPNRWPARATQQRVGMPLQTLQRLSSFSPSKPTSPQSFHLFLIGWLSLFSSINLRKTWRVSCRFPRSAARCCHGSLPLAVMALSRSHVGLFSRRKQQSIVHQAGRFV